MSKDTRKNLKIPEWLDDKLNEYCKKVSLKKRIVAERLIEEGIDLDLLNPEWIDRVIGDRITSLKREGEVKSDFKIEELKFKEVLAWKRIAFRELIKSIPEDRKREELQRLIGDLNDPTFFDRLGSIKTVMVDGEPRNVPLERGMPKLIGVDPSEIIECEMGFHVKNNKCNCKKWFSCEIRLEEREQYKKKVQLEEEIKKIIREFKVHYGQDLSEEEARKIALQKISNA